MVTVLDENSFERSVQIKKPWENTGSRRSIPLQNEAQARVISEEKLEFTFPIGVKKSTFTFKRVSSVYREVTCPSLNARAIECHQFTMQAISLLIILPNNIAGLKDIDNEHLKEKLPDLVGGLKEKRIVTTFPSKLSKELDKAKVKYRAQECSAPEKCIPSGQEFFVNGPFILVLYDQANECPVAICRVYDSAKINKEMKTLIKKYRKMDKKLIKERTKLESTASASWLKLKSNFKKASTQSESLHKTSENHASPDVRVDDDTSGVEMIKHPLQRGSGSVSTIIQKYETAQRGAQRGAQPQVAPVKVKPVQSTGRLGVSNAFNTQLNQTLQAPPTMHDDEVSLMGSTRSIVSELSPELQMDLKRLTAGSRSVEGSTEPFVLRPKPRWRATPAATPSPPSTPTPRRYPPPSPSLRRCTPPPLPLPPVIINARPKFSMPPTPPPLPKAPVDTVKRKIESTPPPRRMPANGIPTPFIAQKTRAARLAQRVESSPTDESDSSSESESDEAPRGRSPPAPHHPNAAKAAMFKQNVPMPCGEQLAAIRRKANEIQSRFSQHFPFET